MSPPPVKSTHLPEKSWQHLASDLLGPLSSRESILVTVDYFSRFFEVDILGSTTSNTVIIRQHAYFARYGVPERLRSDNNSQFFLKNFVSFSLRWVSSKDATYRFGHAQTTKSNDEIAPAEGATNNKRSWQALENRAAAITVCLQNDASLHNQYRSGRPFLSSPRGDKAHSPAKSNS